MDNREIYQLLEKQESNIKELFGAHNTAIRAKIESENTILGMKIDALTDYQKIQNGRTTQNSENISNLAKDTRIWRLIHRNPKVAIIIIVLAIIGVTSSPLIIDLISKIF